MTITVKCLAATEHYAGGPTLYTFEARYPRFIHSEVMTHRDFSRNASSSRAIPTLRLLRDILRDPAVPVEWGSNKPGMQAGAALTGWKLRAVKAAWFGAMYVAVGAAYVAHKAGAHKQIVNRIVEPWSHITVVISSTKWDNFFNLRCHPAADPTMRELADAILVARASAQVVMRNRHRPYYETNDTRSVAACARVSYLNHDRTETDPEKDRALYDMLASSKHLSPFEHVAWPVTDGSGRSNFGPDWIQLRSQIE